MIVRLWRTRVKAEHVTQYALWEQTRSLPMFRSLPGCLGAMFLRTSVDCCALTFWKDAESVAALQESDLYKTTSAAYAASGMLEGTPSLEIFEVVNGFDVRMGTVMS
jgi:heme-degrading monooxygenase HmoA